MLNKLLSRKQMIMDVIHTDMVMPSKKTLKEKIADKFKVDSRNVVLFGFKT
jgi:small subunit ribosomal protein S24e